MYTFALINFTTVANNTVFIQSLMSGEDGTGVAFGRSEVNKPLNRFKNIFPCELITSC